MADAKGQPLMIRRIFRKANDPADTVRLEIASGLETVQLRVTRERDAAVFAFIEKHAPKIGTE